MLTTALLIILAFTLGVFTQALIQIGVIDRRPKVKRWADCGDHYIPRRVKGGHGPYWFDGSG